MLLRYALTSLQIALVAVCGYLFYGTGAVLIGSEELPAWQRDQANRPEPESHADIFSVIAKRNLFKTPDKPLPVEPEPEPQEDLEETELRIKLIGTGATDDPTFAIAVLEDQVANKRHSMRIGDVIQTAELVSITRRRVVIENNGKRQAVSMEDEDDKKPQTASNTRVKPRANTRGAARRRGRGQQRKQLSDRIREITQQGANKQAGGLQPGALPLELPEKVTGLMEQANFRPSFGEDGQINGIAISNVKPGSALADAGIRDGDQVLEVNGRELKGPEDLPALLADFSQPKAPQVQGGTVPPGGAGGPTCVRVRGEDGNESEHCF